MYQISKEEWGKVEARFAKLSKQLKQARINENTAWAQLDKALRELEVCKLKLELSSTQTISSSKLDKYI